MLSDSNRVDFCAIGIAGRPRIKSMKCFDPQPMKPQVLVRLTAAIAPAGFSAAGQS